MEPKPVITYFGEKEIFGPVLQKKLHTRLSQLQHLVAPKDEGAASVFSSLCSGVEFLDFSACHERFKSNTPFYQQPALHTYWCSSYDLESYRKHDYPLIKQWLDSIAKQKGGASDPMKLVIYCVTAEVRAKRHKALSMKSSSVEERLRTDFKTAVNDIIVFRLASSEESRLVESFQFVVHKLNSMALTKFHNDIEKEKEVISNLRGVRSDPETFYNNLFLRKLDLAIACEMTVRHEEALSLYIESTTNLEGALTMFIDSTTPPQWLESLCHAPCPTWDYPKLVWTQISWQYLSGVRGCSSPLLHIRTFLLVRVAHLLFVLERAWSVSELVISTLHCMARETKMLKLSFPLGAFHCWAYMACNEAIQAFMGRISPDSLVSATSSLLLVRAELWHYALQKLHDIGLLCGLMPSSNKLNHDQVLVNKISSGITPVQPHLITDTDIMGVEDHGKKLLTMLNDKKSFQTEFLTLGEMVIGAFKHAGRRRMAFRVGTMIAQFHRDLGLMLEAEELLSDICRFYSEDQWTELSTKAYSLLADCQMKLRLEEKHISTMLLLASFPPYPAASHDPSQWMDKIIRIAQRSPYQKLLNWEPLLKFVKMELVDEDNVYLPEETISIDLVIKYHGPKDIKSLIIIVETKRATSLQRLLSSPEGDHTPYRGITDVRSNTPSNFQANLEDLDLEQNISHYPRSRPIGDSSKHRSTSQMMTHHVSHAVIQEMEAAWKREEVGGAKRKQLIMMGSKVTLTQGENRIRVQGKASKLGDFAPHKVNVKFGSLDFMYTVELEKAKDFIFSICSTPVNMDISLTPQEGVFLAGYSQRCSLCVATHGGTSIPEGSQLRVVVNGGTEIEFLSPTISKLITREDTEEEGEAKEEVSEHCFPLPAIPPDSSHECHMILNLQAMRCIYDHTVCDNSQDHLSAWKHEMEVYCDWLDPPYMASLSLTVYEPLALTCLEHSGEGNCFLQLLLRNTSPLPLAIRDPGLKSGLDLEKLHGNIPKVLQSQENYSFLWRVHPDGTRVVKERAPSSLMIQYSPLPLPTKLNNETPSTNSFQSVNFEFLLSNMQSVYELTGRIEPSREHSCLLALLPAYLTFKIHNSSPKETEFGTPDNEITPTSLANYKLGYKLCLDKRAWTLYKGHSCGVINNPAPQDICELTFQVTPLRSGSLSFPTLTLSSLPLDTPVDKWREDQSLGTALSNAQVYDLSRGMVVAVDTSSVIGR